MLLDAAILAFAERGECIWRAGDPSEYMGIVGDGFVKMVKCSSNGQESAMELLGPGQCFGMMAAIEGRAFPLSALAATNCWYVKIPTHFFLTVYHSNNRLKDQIVRSIGPRLRRAHEMISRFSSGKVDQRIAAVLFILADSFGVQKEGAVEIQVPLTRQDLGEMAGTTTETSIRILSRWQKEGLLKTDNRFMTILNERELGRLLT